MRDSSEFLKWKRDEQIKEERNEIMNA